VAWAALSAAAPAAALKSNFGHYIAAQPYDPIPEIASLCEHPGVSGVIVRRPWTEVEPSQGVYDWSTFDAVLAAIASSRNPQCQLWLFVEFKTFVRAPVKNPCPVYLQAQHSAPTAPLSNGAYACFIWDPVTSDAFIAMMQAAAARYDANPRVEGFIVQESALGFNDAQSQDAPNRGTYSSAVWRDTLIRFGQECAAAFTRSRCMFFLNFIRGGQERLREVANAHASIPDRHICMSGPDVLPNSSVLYAGADSAYQVLIDYDGCRANSVQDDSYQVPGCALSCIFHFAVSGTFGTFNADAPLTSGLCINSYLFWNHRTRRSSTGLDWTNALPVIAANPHGPSWHGRCAGGGTT
jgi:hypothetical protein